MSDHDGDLTSLLYSQQQNVGQKIGTIPPSSSNSMLSDSPIANGLNSTTSLDIGPSAGGNQEEFFNSYIPDRLDSPDKPHSSSCSDSVSRCGDAQRSSKKTASYDENNLRSLNNTNHHHPAWYTQIQSDSSSLVTLVSEKKMSDSRRTFCLFVTFDFILTVLLWLIECGTSASSEHYFFDIVRLQIENYAVNNSLFDVVCLAIARFLFLQIMYAAIRIRHWWGVAISTSVTDILLILKIFPIFENAASTDFMINISMTVVLLLTNFILSWIEVWFIDFKVLPAEAKLANRTVKEFLQQSHYQKSLSFNQNDALASEKTPLLRGYSNHTPPQSFYTGVTSDRASYHSIPESDFASCISERQLLRKQGNISSGQISKEDAAHVEKGKGALNQLWLLFRNDGIWKVEKELDNGDILYTTNVPGYGKTFRIDSVVYGVTAQQVFQEIIVKAENMPEWNSTVQEVKVIKRIGSQTALSLEVSKPAANGFIKSRDFLTVRRVDKFGQIYISAGVSTDFEVAESGRIRGVNGPTGFIVEPCISNGYNACKFVWILNTDLKGSIPQYLVHSNLSATLINFVSAMKKYLGADS